MHAVPPIPSTKQERCRRQQFSIVFVNKALEWLLSENDEMFFIFIPFLGLPHIRQRVAWLAWSSGLEFAPRDLLWRCFFRKITMNFHSAWSASWTTMSRVKSNQSPSWCKNILNCSISSHKGKGSIVSQDLKLTENIWSCSERPWYFAGIFQIFRRDIPNVAVVPFNFSASAA